MFRWYTNKITLWLQNIYGAHTVLLECVIADKSWISQQTDRADVSMHIFMLKMQQILSQIKATMSLISTISSPPPKNPFPLIWYYRAKKNKQKKKQQH